MNTAELTLISMTITSKSTLTMNGVGDTDTHTMEDMVYHTVQNIMTRMPTYMGKTTATMVQLVVMATHTHPTCQLNHINANTSKMNT